MNVIRMSWDRVQFEMCLGPQRSRECDAYNHAHIQQDPQSLQQPPSIGSVILIKQPM
jgi:hypothetical protein